MEEEIEILEKDEFLGGYTTEPQSTTAEFQHTPREMLRETPREETSPVDIENDFDFLPDAKDVIEIEVDQSKKEYKSR